MRSNKMGDCGCLWFWYRLRCHRVPNVISGLLEKAWHSHIIPDFQAVSGIWATSIQVQVYTLSTVIKNIINFYWSGSFCVFERSGNMFWLMGDGFRIRDYRVGEAQDPAGLQFHNTLIQFSSIRQIFTEHILHARCYAVVLGPPKMGFPCSLFSARSLTFRNSKISIRIITMTAHNVMMLRSTEGRQGVGMCMQLGLDENLGRKSSSHMVVDTEWEGCLWQQLCQSRNWLLPSYADLGVGFLIYKTGWSLRVML